MTLPQRITLWSIRLATIALLCSTLLAGRQIIFSAHNVYLHRGLLYSKHEGRPADGKLELRDANGQLLLRGTLLNGKLTGSVEEWYPDGRPKTRYEYLNHDKLVEVYKWYPDGALAELYQMTRTPTGFGNSGRALSWYENGTQKHLLEYDQGKPAHVEIGWDENGNRTMKSLHREADPRASFLIPESFGVVGLTQDNSDADTKNDEN